MMGKLIVIEGSDSSGKETQTKILYEKLIEDNYNIRKVEYPNYSSNSSELVKMYLSGEFGKNPSDVNPYAASTFYAVDRFASYKKEWVEFYKASGIILADRYTTANMVHQAAKIEDIEKRDYFLDWLWDFEFNKMELPVPDCVIFLDMPVEYAQRLMEERNNKITGESKKDIHEKNKEYMSKSYKSACYVAEKYKWNRISCISENKLKTIDEISDEIYKIVKKCLQ